MLFPCVSTMPMLFCRPLVAVSTHSSITRCTEGSSVCSIPRTSCHHLISMITSCPWFLQLRRVGLACGNSSPGGKDAGLSDFFFFNGYTGLWIWGDIRLRSHAVTGRLTTRLALTARLRDSCCKLTSPFPYSTPEKSHQLSLSVPSVSCGECGLQP